MSDKRPMFGIADALKNSSPYGQIAALLMDPAYQARVGGEFQAGLDQSAQGFGDVVERGNLATGIPRMALGGAQWVNSPLTAAVAPAVEPVVAPIAGAFDQGVSQPVESMTGYPHDIMTEIAMAMIPGNRRGMRPAQLRRMVDEAAVERTAGTFNRQFVDEPGAAPAAPQALPQGVKHIWDTKAKSGMVDDDRATAILRIKKSLAGIPYKGNWSVMRRTPEVIARSPRYGRDD